MPSNTSLSAITDKLCPDLSCLVASRLTLFCQGRHVPSTLVAHTSQGSSSTDIPTTFTASESKPLGNTIESPESKQVSVQELTGPTVSEQESVESSLWALAYECFQRQDSELAQKFSKCLGIDAEDIKAGFDRLVLKALEEIRKAQEHKDSLYKTPLGTYLKKAVEIIIASKAFIGSAVAAEPHAALAWCGVSLLLPVSVPGIGTDDMN